MRSNMQKQSRSKGSEFSRPLIGRLLVVGGIFLASCGGGGQSDAESDKLSGEKQIQAVTGSWVGRVPPSISGKVLDGYIAGARVFWDCNGNWRADSNEIATTSGRGGSYRIGAAPKTTCILRAEVGVGAVDEDTNSPNIRRFVMSALPGKPILVTPITTLVAMGAGTEESVAAALGIPSDLTRDYLFGLTADARSHNAARTVAAQLQSVSVDTLSTSSAAQTTASSFVANTQYVLASANSSIPINSSQILSSLANGPASYSTSRLPSQALPATTAVSGKHSLSSEQTALLQEILRNAVVKGNVHGNEVVFSRFSDVDLEGLNPRLEAVFGNSLGVVSILKERQAEIEVLNKEFKSALAGENKFLDAKTTLAITTNALRSLYGIAEVVTALTPSPVGLTGFFSSGVTATGKIRSLGTRTNHLRRFASRVPQCFAAVESAVRVIDKSADNVLTDEDLFLLGSSVLSFSGCISTLIRDDPKLDRVFAEASVASVSKSIVLGDFFAGIEAFKALADIGLSFSPSTAKWQLAFDGALDYILGICQMVKAVEELNEALANNILVKAEQLAALEKPIFDGILKSFKVKILAQRVNPYLSSVDSACLPGAVVVDFVCVSHPSAGFEDNFTSTIVDATKWNIDGWGVGKIGTVAFKAGLAEFAAWGRISTKEKIEFSGNKIVIEARMAGQGGGRDTSIMFVDASTGDYLYSGDTTYVDNGFFAAATGAYNFTQREPSADVPGSALNVTRFGGSTSQFMEYRWTFDGDQFKMERGPTLANITQSRTRTLGKSIAGQAFYLSIGTAGPGYSPGTWDWIRVSSSDATAKQTLRVAANGYPGTAFTNPLSTTARCDITSVGSWTSAPWVNYVGPDGDPLYPFQGGTYKAGDLGAWSLPTAPVMALLMRRSITDLQRIGTSASVTLPPSQQVTFLANDVPWPVGGFPVHAYVDNLGSVEVTITCRQASTQTNDGNLTVSANSIPGATLVVPSGVASCTFNSAGTWSAGPQAPPQYQNADGVIGGNSLNLTDFGVPIPSAPNMALVVKHSSTGKWDLLGSSKTISVVAGETLSFMMNDATTLGYTDGNTGQLSTVWSCH